MKHRKYIKGQPLSFARAVRTMKEGRYVMLWDRPLHPGWGLSMQTLVLLNFCSRGYVSAAKINPKWKAKHS